MAFSIVTTIDDRLFRLTYQFTYHPQVWPVVQIAVTIGNSIPGLHLFTIWRVAGWQRSMRRPPRMRMQNWPPFIIGFLSPGGVSIEGVFHKCSDINMPHPKTAPDQRMINRYFPSQETTQIWDMRPCPCDTQFGAGDCCFVSWTRTLRHRDSNTPPKTTLYITCGTSSTCAAPPKRRLGTCMCLDDVYFKIVYHFIFEHRQSYCRSTKSCFEFLVVLIWLQLSFVMHFVCYIMYDCVHVTLAI